MSGIKPNQAPYKHPLHYNHADAETLLALQHHMVANPSQASLITESKKTMNNPLAKSLLFLAVVFTVIAASFAFAVLHHDDGSNRVNFSLIDHHGQRVTHKNFAGLHKLVFFGFTSCLDVCPTQMAKLTNVLHELEESGHANRISPLFISVDPERDTPEKVKHFLNYFHGSFTGLTGTRVALKSAADSFKTLLSSAPKKPEAGYQITHSSVVYVVDPFDRIVDFIPFEAGIKEMSDRIREQL